VLGLTVGVLWAGNPPVLGGFFGGQPIREVPVMIHFVPLEELPTGFVVPERDQNHFWYDEDKKRLEYDGVMYKATFDRLRGLSSDFKYQRAVEELFRIAVPDDERSKDSGRLLVMAAGVMAVVASLTVGFWLWQRTQADDSPKPVGTSVTTDLAQD
jgi:hypothetical protein